MPTSTKRKAPAKLAAPVVKSAAKSRTKNTIDEQKASVSAADGLHTSKVETIAISSDEDSEEGVSDDDEVEDEEQVNGDAGDSSKPVSRINGNSLPSPNQTPLEGEDDDADSPTSPSFGELLRGNDPIDVPALLQQTSTAGGAVAPPSRSAIVPPSHQSLTTVLSQALKTDDVDLLESCLHTTNLTTIRNTIEHIDSSLAGILLTKLAARLYRRPGRAGNLMTWVQWTLVAHGGALASQPAVTQSLSGLQKVLSERAKGLNSLLALKGKLDLLEGQMGLRRNMQRGSGLISQDEEDEEDENLIWVEGEDEAVAKRVLTNGSGSRRKRARDDGSDDDDMALPNGYAAESDSEEEDLSDDEDVSDDAAEESLDEDEVDHEDVDESMGEDEESDMEAAAAPPSKMQKLGRKFSKSK